MLVTPKTNKKRKLLDSDVLIAGGKEEATEEDAIPVEYETCLQKLENDVRKHIRTEQQLKLHVEQTQLQLEEAYKESVRITQESEEKLMKMQEQVNRKEADLK